MAFVFCYKSDLNVLLGFQESNKHFFTDLRMNCCTKLCVACEKYKSKMLDRGTRQRGWVILSQSGVVKKLEAGNDDFLSVLILRLHTCSYFAAATLYMHSVYVSGQRHIKTVFKKERALRQKQRANLTIFLIAALEWLAAVEISSRASVTNNHKHKFNVFIRFHQIFFFFF